MFLLHHKISGVSSFQALRDIKKTYQTPVVGHSGTLDPFASGYLLVAIGRSTKLLPYLLDTSKKYRVSARFGFESSTGDPTGNLTKIESCKFPDISEIQKVLENTFSGKILQVPPVWSALRIDGRRSYEYARKGIEIQHPPREVEIFGYDHISLDSTHLQFEVHVSSGTYIRSLVEDIGKIFGCGAYVEKLERIEISGQSCEGVISTELLLGACRVEIERKYLYYLSRGLYPGELQRSIHANSVLVCEGWDIAFVLGEKYGVNLMDEISKKFFESEITKSPK